MWIHNHNKIMRWQKVCNAKSCVVINNSKRESKGNKLRAYVEDYLQYFFIALEKLGNGHEVILSCLYVNRIKG